MLLLDKNDLAKALEWQTKAVGLQPDNSVFKLNLARIHIKNGNKDQARKELDELAKLGDRSSADRRRWPNCASPCKCSGF